MRLCWARLHRGLRRVIAAQPAAPPTPRRDRRSAGSRAIQPGGKVFGRRWADSPTVVRDSRTDAEIQIGYYAPWKNNREGAMQGDGNGNAQPDWDDRRSKGEGGGLRIAGDVRRPPATDAV